MTKTVARVETLEKQIGFDVAMMPIDVVGGERIKNHKAIVRLDTGKALAVVSDMYNLIRHDEVILPPLKALAKKGFKMSKAHVIDDGAKVVVEMTGQEHMKINGEDFIERLLLVNSYDKTAAFQVKFGLFRLICSNGAGIWTPDSVGGKIIHKGDKENQFNPKEFMKFIDGREKHIAKFIDIMAKMRDYRVPGETKAREILKELKMGKRLTKDILDRWKNEKANSERNLYGIYNATTSMYSRKAENNTKNAGGAILRTQDKTLEILNGMEKILN